MISSASYRALRKDLVQAGCFEAPTLRSWGKFTLALGIAAALTLPVYAASSAWWLLLLIPASLFLGTAIMIGHEAAHGSACNKGWQNDLLVLAGFGLLSGISTTFWKYKHNVLHHGNPNVPGVDRDLLLGPIAVSGAQHRAGSGAGQWFHRYLQGILVWPLTGFLGPLMRVRSAMVLGRALLAGKADRAWVADALAVSLHYVLWLVVPSFFVGFGWALIIYLTIFVGVGFMLSFIFLLGHTGLPLVEAYDDPWSLQIHTARTVRLTAFGRWFWVGLDSQLVHHLFPKMSHLRAPRAAAPVRAWCLEHGLEPLEENVWQATASVAGHLVTSWKDEPVDLRVDGVESRQDSARHG